MIIKILRLQREAINILSFKKRCTNSSTLSIKFESKSIWTSTSIKIWLSEFISLRFPIMIDLYNSKSFT